ncbi:TetR family transcriptional regulator [Lactococcus insecticola]|uniref:TetR family transcriptional regulator n=1 Tax=Pseudolactococcus insecticola TaxID=2709158 RepID=A0A6A0B7N6_9LACT|nr:TetR family transcriptional regulator [Lactococcus insecticola]GFH40364.1 TetR family transcriptional regulator [Lactococcus insecticola]
MSSREKLEQAAIELITQQGYQQTTAQQIADRAGVTERTFFRQFSDKSDVLFSKTEDYIAHYADGLSRSTADTLLSKVYDVYYFVASTLFKNLHGHAKQRQLIIQSEPALIERELYKAYEVVQFLTEQLSVEFEPLATRLSVQSMNVVFHTAYEKWLAQPNDDAVLADIFADTYHAWQQLNQ